MLDKSNTCKPQRRQFLQSAGAVTLSGLATESLAEIHAAEPLPEASADSVILLWMGGGMASTETFDPKPFTPFEKGVSPKKILCTFPAIDTACDHIKVSQGLERVASVMDKATLIRSFTSPDLGHASHLRHQYHWLTGHPPTSSPTAPHFGSAIAKILGPKNPLVPPFINIGLPAFFREGHHLTPAHTTELLGSESAPFIVPFPQRQDPSPTRSTLARLDQFHQGKQRNLSSITAGPFEGHAQSERLSRLEEKRILNSPAANALDLSLESVQTRKQYGEGRFGRGCLLARRLVEAGARFVEVTTGSIPFSDCDTHEHGHKRMKLLKKEIDSAIAQLVLDLEDRGLLARTLVIVASEFSRAMITKATGTKRSKFQPAFGHRLTSMKSYGLHQHFTGAGSILLFGGGVKRGHLHGATADEHPCTTIQDPVVIEDLHATIYKILGISPLHKLEVDSRRFNVTRDGLGKPIDSLLS